MPTPKPPPIAGAEPPGPAELARRLTSWTLRGYAYAARQPSTPIATRALSAAFWVIGTTIRPVLQVVARRTVLAPSRRFYATGDAILGIQARPDGWHITDHLSTTPGAGHGARLRQLVVDELLQVADHHGIALHLTTRHAQLATLYQAEIPGLHQVGCRSPTGLISLARDGEEGRPRE